MRLDVPGSRGVFPLPLINANCAEGMMTLTFARGYSREILEKAKVLRLLIMNYRDILSEFETIAQAQTL